MINSAYSVCILNLRFKLEYIDLSFTEIYRYFLKKFILKRKKNQEKIVEILEKNLENSRLIRKVWWYSSIIRNTIRKRIGNASVFRETKTKLLKLTYFKLNWVKVLFVNGMIIYKMKHCTKNEIFHSRFLQYMLPNPKENVDLVSCTEEDDKKKIV